MAVSVAAEWSAFSNRYYRKMEIYRMLWNKVDLLGHKVACSKFGGPIAIIRDDSKIVQLRSEPARPKLLIFTSSGGLIASIPWDKPGGRLVGLGWSDNQILHCVMQDGNVFRYDVHGKLIPGQGPSGSGFNFGQECWEQAVAECIIWGNGIVCLTEANELFCVTDLSTPNPIAIKLASPNLEDPPHCMAIIEPQHTVSGNVEVLLAVESTVRVIDIDSVHDQETTIGPLGKMTASPNGNLVACFTHDGRLLVLTSDFSRTISEFDAQSALPPEQLVWCGMDSVLMYWEDGLLMVGPYGDYTRYTYDEPLVLIPECDGVRILSNTYTEFLHRVPDSTVSIFSIGSTSPGAMLYDAYDHFSKRNAKADENIRLIGSSLSEAVESCIDAAGHEFDIQLQSALMHAAVYGRTFCRSFPKNRIREMVKYLSVLNAVRDPSTGMPLTLQQLKVLTETVLIKRLVVAHKHLLAVRISEYLGLSPDEVAVHWACVQISAASSVPDAELCNFLIEKIKVYPGLSYAAIAAHAYKSNRRTLAGMLLEHEPKSSEQVPLLTKMGEEEKALEKAIKSGDTDLVYFTIFHLWQKKTPSEFTRVVHDKPLARNLFVVYARQNEPDVLKKFFATLGQYNRVGEVLFWESWLQSKSPQFRQGSSLQGPRIRLIEEAHRFFSQTKEHDFEAKVCEEQVRLLKVQQELEAKTGKPIFVDTSVSDTIRTCIVLGLHRDAQKIRAEFKIPDKRFYWLKVLALAYTKNWDALDKFSKEKKPPTGYKPFVEACIQEGETAEALKYIVKLSDPEEKAEAYAQLGMNKEAAEVASQARDNELLGRLKSTFGQSTTAAALFDTIRDRLSLQGA